MNEEYEKARLIERRIDKKSQQIVFTYEYLGVNIERRGEYGKFILLGLSHECWSMDEVVFMIEEYHRVKEWERQDREFAKMMPIHITPLELASHLDGLDKEGKVYDVYGHKVDVGPWNLQSPPHKRKV